MPLHSPLLSLDGEEEEEKTERGGIGRMCVARVVFLLYITSCINIFDNYVTP